MPQASDSIHFKGSHDIVLSLIPDSIFQSLSVKEIYPQKEVMFYDSAAANCPGTPYGESWCGDLIVETPGTSLFLFGEDTLFISRLDSIRTCIVKNDTITVVRDIKNYQTLYNGNADSTWTFQLFSTASSDLGYCISGKQLILSKNNGLVSFPACFNEYRIMDQNSNIPAYNAVYSIAFRAGNIDQFNYTTYGLLDFFDYSIGDRLIYRRFTSGGPGHSGTAIWTSKVTAKSISTTGVTYTFQDSGKIINSSGTSWFNNTSVKTYRFEEFDFRHSGNIHTNSGSNHARMTFNHVAYIDKIGDNSHVIDSCAYEKDWSATYTLKQSRYKMGVGLWTEYRLIKYGHPEFTELVGYSIGNTIGNAKCDLGTLEVYPNPAKSFVEVSGLPERSDFLDYQIFDLTGRLVSKGSVCATNNMIDISKLASGTYLLQVADYRITKLIKI